MKSLSCWSLKLWRQLIYFFLQSPDRQQHEQQRQLPSNVKRRRAAMQPAATHTQTTYWQWGLSGFSLLQNCRGSKQLLSTTHIPPSLRSLRGLSLPLRTSLRESLISSMVSRLTRPARVTAAKKDKIIKGLNIFI